MFYFNFSLSSTFFEHFIFIFRKIIFYMQFSTVFFACIYVVRLAGLSICSCTSFNPLSSSVLNISVGYRSSYYLECHGHRCLSSQSWLMTACTLIYEDIASLYLYFLIVRPVPVMKYNSQAHTHIRTETYIVGLPVTSDSSVTQIPT